MSRKYRVSSRDYLRTTYLPTYLSAYESIVSVEKRLWSYFSKGVFNGISTTTRIVGTFFIYR